MGCASAHNDAGKQKEKILSRQFEVKNRDSKKLAGFKLLRAENHGHVRGHIEFAIINVSSLAAALRGWLAWDVAEGTEYVA